MTKTGYFLLVFLVLSLTCVFCCWQLLPQRPKTPQELLEPLTTTQIQCVEKITNKDSLVYLEVQKNKKFMAIGYNTGNELHAVVVIMNEKTNCTIEFDEVVSKLQYIDYGDQRVISSFMEFGAEDITGDQIPEIYIGLRSNYGRHQGAYTFYSKQADASYKKIGEVSLLCASFHSFNIIKPQKENRSKIFISDDMRCDDWIFPSGHDMTRNFEYQVTQDGLEDVNFWIGSPDGQIKYDHTKNFPYPTIAHQ